MKPWAGYVRVSHVGGRAGDRFRSPDDQAREIEGWAARRGEPLVMLPPELDESGGRADRPILMDAVQRIEAGEYRGLVVAYLSRAGRSVKHMLELWDRIERAGGEIHAVAENIDTTTPSGRLTRTMLAAIAEHELDLHRERFENLRADATRAGIWQRRQTPLGYRRDPATRKLVPDEHAGRVVEAFQARAAHVSLSQIGQRLGMTNSGAAALLRNRVYLGELRVGEHVNPAAHPPLIDEDLWLSAQHARPARPSRTGGPPALLAGLARCTGCGHVMSRARHTRALVYGCHRHHSAGTCPAPATVTMHLLDRHVEEIALAALVRMQTGSSVNDTEIQAARAAVQDAERELATYLEAVSAADVGAEAFAAGARSRRQQVEQARTRLAGALGAVPENTITGDVGELWASFDQTQRNQLLRGLIEVVLVERSGGRGVIRPLEDRVRVIAYGAGLVEPYQGGGRALPVRSIRLPDRDDPVTLRVGG